MFLPGCDAILDSSIWGHARYVYVSNPIYVSYIYGELLHAAGQWWTTTTTDYKV